MVDLCRHIKTDGHRCGTPAVHGTHFCYHHSQRKAAIKQARVALSLANPHMPIPFVFPEDRTAIQHNLYLVALALASKRISERTANTYTSIWRACRVNLGKTPLVETNHDTAVQRVILTPEGDEIALPREALEKDEALAHGPECPCRKCAEQYRNAPPELHHHDCNCGLCEHTDQPSSPIPDAPSASKVEEQEPSVLSVSAVVNPASAVIKPSGSSGSIATLQAVVAPIPGFPSSDPCSMGWETVARQNPELAFSPQQEKQPRPTEAPCKASARGGKHPEHSKGTSSGAKLVSLI